MSTVYLTVGISGSGKSRYGEIMKTQNPSLKIICPDDIRKELTGSISDQSRNKEVWDLAYNRLKNALESGNDVYFSATTLNPKSYKAVKEIAESVNANVEILLFKDSYDWRLCQERVNKDIKNGVDRSNTLVLVGEDNNKIPLIQSMSNRFVDMAKWLALSGIKFKKL